jgi:POT family proton-dependent oligopeptide transporter
MSVTPGAARDFLGHPRGLAVLFATEAWERFSYFGNAALVVLYMTKYLLEPGRFEAVLGLEAVKAALELVFGRLERQPLASQLFGFYTGLAYFTPVLGGLVADRLLGRHRTVIIGGLLMALGHFLMAFETLFLVALSLLIVGIGAFKPNISSEVGALYAPGDDRRDRACSSVSASILPARARCQGRPGRPPSRVRARRDGSTRANGVPCWRSSSPARW